MKKILLSGIKPTGRPHIGNYFGAMQQFVKMQDDYECYIFTADYHALTSVSNGAELAQSTIDLAIDYLAVGLDPKKVTLFKQADVPELAELTWIFNCITTMPYLMRAHAFKDAEAKNKEINVGLFDYPVLMAADILMPDADIVPVGQDQKQHVEIARDTAQKFNRTFCGTKGDDDTGGIFKLPEALILSEVAVVPGIDGQKMSKSYKNTIPLFAEDDEIRDCVARIVTDSSGETPVHVRAIHELFRDKTYLDALYTEHKGKYKALKDALAEDVIVFIAPLREKRKAIAADVESVKAILKAGGEKARARAIAKMEQVRKVTGLTI